MAKYNIVYQCGHEDTLELYGKSSQRDWAIEKAEESLCPECEAIEYAKRNNLEIVEMHYGEYKNNFSSNSTVRGSYNKEGKTIKVYMPKADALEDSQQAAEEFDQVMINTAKVLAKGYVPATVSQLNQQRIKANALPPTSAGEKQMHINIINFLLEVK